MKTHCNPLTGSATCTAGQSPIRGVKKASLVACLLLCASAAFAQVARVDSPNGKISVGIDSRKENGEWFLGVKYKEQTVIPEISLGLVRSDQSFGASLKFVGADAPKRIEEKYAAIHGKRSECTNSANEVVMHFENPDKSKLDVIVRAYNDGVAFRYAFPEGEGSYVVKDELTAYTIPEDAKRWMERWVPSNENLYTTMANGDLQQEWGYPALFNVGGEDGCWYLLHEADVDRRYCGTKLSNQADKNQYKLTFPNPRDGNGLGESQPTINLPWESPWRVIILGSLADVVESTLVKDVSTPSKIGDAEWVKPGKASWNYWSHNHGTRDFKIVCEFADLAAEMGWPYTLIDWEWDSMGNGGNLEDALKYIQSKGVTPLMWYNSGGPHTGVPATPRDRMLTHESRMKEFAKLKELGVVGVKVDFFESEKQDMIDYYLDILEDAAQFEIMVYFHGCIVPRGWSRTYPNLMTLEGIRGAEWYNNGPQFTRPAPEHNTIVTFTRNVVGPMDYTPVTFTDSQFPHITSFGHELALSVVFESGIQHLADRPSGYRTLPDAAKTFLKEVPAAWDDTKLLAGYPGRDAVVARRKGDTWYIGAINAEEKEKLQVLDLGFLPAGITYQMTLIADGEKEREFDIKTMQVDRSASPEIKMLPHGGFAVSLKLVKE